jgi:hypothetical protein
MSRVWLCVRCGVLPRQQGTFLCEPCAMDPQQGKEVDEAAARTRDEDQKINIRAARNYLVGTLHWHGRWSTRG